MGMRFTAASRAIGASPIRSVTFDSRCINNYWRRRCAVTVRIEARPLPTVCDQRLRAVQITTISSSPSTRFSGTHHPGGLGMKTATIAITVLAALTFAVPSARGQQPDKEHAELAKALGEAKIPLQRGLTASAKEGKPISAKYEVEHGQLQLSVYTMKADKFSEVIVDHKTGKVAKTEPITEGDD